VINHSTQRPGYETRVMSVSVVTWFGVGLIVSAIAIFLAVAGLYGHFKRQHPSRESSSRIAFDVHTIPPPPQLQANPAFDLERFNVVEDARLNSYGWIDKKTGIIRIPIERAMDLIAERGLPTRGPGTQNSSGKTSIQMQQEKAAATK
jgi:hypothetical protein